MTITIATKPYSIRGIVFISGTFKLSQTSPKRIAEWRKIIGIIALQNQLVPNGGYTGTKRRPKRQAVGM
jgi:hypothetical protein